MQICRNTLVLVLTTLLSSCGSAQDADDGTTTAGDAPVTSTDPEPSAEPSTDVAAPAEPSDNAARAPADAPLADEGWPSLDECNVLTALQANPNTSTFLELAGLVNMTNALETLQGATVLVPVNAAFAALPAEALEALRGDRPRLRNALAGHHLMGTMRTSSLRERENIEVLAQSRDSYPITSEGDMVSIGPAQLRRADVECGGSIIHLVDVVLVPGSFNPEQAAGPFGVNLWVLDEE